MPFRAAVQRALAAPLGVPAARLFGAAAVTALVADGRGDERDAVALAELVAHLASVGLPRGRQFVLLAGQSLGAAARAHAVRLRTVLGLPVIVHADDGPCFRAGHFADGSPLDLDDELREAEEIVFAASSGQARGPALLWPGLAPGAAAGAWHAALAALSAPEREAATAARVRETLECVPVRFALAWDGGAAPRVVAGAPLEAFAACAGERRDG